MGEQFKQLLRDNPDVVEKIKRDPIYKQRQIVKVNFSKRVMGYAERAKNRARQYTNIS